MDRLRFLGTLLVLSCVAIVSCSDSPDDVLMVEEDVTFTGEVAPLKAFSHDTGLIPSGSPAQVSLKLSAGGAAKITAVGTLTDGDLRGQPGGGKLAVDVHVKMDGRLKIDSPIKPVDGDIPGLADIDIPISGGVAFEPFLTKDGERASVEAAIPETKLPDIPLGSTPGKLQLTVQKKSVLTTTFRGSCLAITGGRATYTGEVVASGTVFLKGTLVLDLPAPLNKAVDLGVIEVPVPGVKTALDLGAIDLPSARDARSGSACPKGAQDRDAAAPSSSSSSDSGSSGEEPDSGPRTCRDELSVVACLDCCAAQHPVGAAVADTATRVCLCDRARCKTACAASVCAGNFADNACEGCISAYLEECDQVFTDACEQHDDCVAYRQCYVQAGCYDKP